MKPTYRFDESCVRTYLELIVHTAYAYVKNISDAEDIAQDVLIRALEKNKVFESKEHRKAWLLRVCINMCKNHLRSPWLKRRRAMPADLEDPTDVHEGLLELVLELDPKYRSVLHLYYYVGYSIEEIARLLKKKPATIGTRLARGRALLRERVKESR